MLSRCPPSHPGDVSMYQVQNYNWFSFEQSTPLHSTGRIIPIIPCMHTFIWIDAYLLAGLKIFHQPWQLSYLRNK